MAPELKRKQSDQNEILDTTSQQYDGSDSEGGEQLYEVERILAERCVDGGSSVEYLTKWLGWVSSLLYWT